VHDQLTAERYLAAAADQQDRLSELLGTDPAARPVGWPLRGELISHLDRLRGELRATSTAAGWQPGHPGRDRARLRCGVLIADGEVGSGIVDADLRAVPDIVGQQRPRDLGVDVSGDVPAQRPRAVDRVESCSAM
jgi:hypothetical protein